MDAALFDGCGVRVFILVNHVLVGRLVHKLLDFGLDPRGAESSQIVLGVLVEDELVVDGSVDGLRVARNFREHVGLGVDIKNVRLDCARRLGIQFAGVVQGHMFSCLWCRNCGAVSRAESFHP